MKKYKMNNKGFTLVELLATVVLLALVIGIASYSINAIIKNSQEKNYQLLINNIYDATEVYYQECKYTNNTGITCSEEDGSLFTSLGDLVTYGYLKGNSTDTKNNQTIENPNDNVNISACKIKITYKGGTIQIEAVNPTGSCPKEY